jgi:hypothetical protein
MLGEWLFVETIGGIDFVERFNFTQTATGTENGTGFALDVPRRAACEYQVTGAYAGRVLCLDLAATGDTISNAYAFKYGLDETFSGAWVSPTTTTEYPMKGFRVKAPNGAPRAAVLADPEFVQAFKSAVSRLEAR